MNQEASVEALGGGTIPATRILVGNEASKWRK